VEIGNALMAGQGIAAVPNSRSGSGWARVADLSEFVPTESERLGRDGDEVTPAVLRVVKSLLDSGHDVVMLSRRNSAPFGNVSYDREWSGRPKGLEHFLEYIRSFLLEEERERVTASTAHKYKGLEKAAVIVLDANADSYPLIHPNWFFLRLFGDSIQRIEAEERRLFYVALTRTQCSLVVLCDSPQRATPYLNDIRGEMEFSAVSWDDLNPVPLRDGARLEVRVYGPFDVREQLGKLGYRYEHSDTSRRMAVTAEGFTLDSLCLQPWARDGVRIEVYSEAGELLERRSAAN